MLCKEPDTTTIDLVIHWRICWIFAYLKVLCFLQQTPLRGGSHFCIYVKTNKLSTSRKQMMGWIHYIDVCMYMPREHALWVHTHFRIFSQVELEHYLKLYKPIDVLHSGELVHSSLGRLGTEHGSCRASSINPFLCPMLEIVG